MKVIFALLLSALVLSHASVATTPPMAVIGTGPEVKRSRRLRRFLAWVAQCMPRLTPLGARLAAGLALGATAVAVSGVFGLPFVGLALMAYGTNDMTAITTNELVKKFEPTIVPLVEEGDQFGPWFKTVPKPAGIEKTVNVIVDLTVNEAERQAPLAPRIGKKREAYEVEISVLDKLRESWPIAWEKIRKSRLDEVEVARDKVVAAVLRARIREAGRFLLSGAAFNSGTPQDPALPSTGQTPNWWGSNDTVAPPAYGENTFSAGHDHIETGAAVAITLDRLLDLRKLLLEHGYGQAGVTVLHNLAEEITAAKLANVGQQNVTLNPTLREELQRFGRVAGVNGFLGMTWIQNDYVPAGALGMWDSRLPNLPMGGAWKLEEVPLTPNSAQDDNIQATWLEAWEQHGFGILHKGAGLTAHVA